MLIWLVQSVPREVLEDYKMTSMTLEFRCECTQSDLLESMSSPSVIGASNNDSVNTKPDLQYIYTCFVYKTLKPSWSKPEQNGILSKTQVMQGYELKTVDALDGVGEICCGCFVTIHISIFQKIHFMRFSGCFTINNFKNAYVRGYGDIGLI